MSLVARATARATALAAATACPLALLVPAHAEEREYVALGDSYSSGLGTGSYLEDGTACRRSPYAYPALVAARTGHTLDLRACARARVADVTALQLDALDAGTDQVTISVGGNDAGFFAVMARCALPRWLGRGGSAIDRARAYVTGTLPAVLAALYADVRSRAPEATVVVVGYPQVFNGEDCNAGTWFSPSEQARLNATTELVNATTAAAAEAAGFAFADPTRRFTGHAVCDDEAWVNGLSSPVAESYHPTRRGQRRGYLPLVLRVLTGERVTGADLAPRTSGTPRVRSARP